MIEVYAFVFAGLSGALLGIGLSFARRGLERQREARSLVGALPTPPPPPSAPYRDDTESRLAALHAEIDRVEGEIEALREQARAIGGRS